MGCAFICLVQSVLLSLHAQVERLIHKLRFMGLHAAHHEGEGDRGGRHRGQIRFNVRHYLRRSDDNGQERAVLIEEEQFHRNMQDFIAEMSSSDDEQVECFLQDFSDRVTRLS